MIKMSSNTVQHIPLDVESKLQDVLAGELAKGINADIMKSLFTMGKRDIIIENTRIKVKAIIRNSKIDDLLK